MIWSVLVLKLTKALAILCLVGVVEARAQLPATCGSHIATVKPTVGQRLQLLMPANVRRHVRELLPAARQAQLDALHARLAELLPADFATRILERPWRMHLDEFVPDHHEKAKLRKQWLFRLNEAIGLLAEIQEVTDQQIGADSEASGLVEFSRALLYNFTTDKQEAVRRRDPRYSYGVTRAHNDFDRAAIEHARRAAALLAAADSPYALAAQLHLTKQLVQSAIETSNRNRFHLHDRSQVAPDEAMAPLLAEAESTLEELLATYMSRTDSEDLRGWIYIGAMMQRFELERLQFDLDFGMGGPRASRTQRAQHFEALLERGGGVLSVVASNRAVLARLLAEKGDGALAHLMMTLVCDHSDLGRPELDARKEGLRALWLRMKEGIEVDDYLRELRQLGYDFNDGTARLR